MRTDRIVAATNILATAKLAKLTPADKAATIKAYQALRKEAEDYDALQKAAIEKAKPEGFDDMHSRHEAKTLTETEEAEYTAKLREFNLTVGLAVEEEAAKERTPEFAPVSAEAMNALVESNPDMTLSQIDVLDRVLTGK